MVMIPRNSAKITGKDFEITTSGCYYVKDLMGASNQK